MTIKITILGATGSIGKSTLDIVRQQPDHFKIVGLTTNTNIVQFEKLLKVMTLIFRIKLKKKQ